MRDRRWMQTVVRCEIIQNLCTVKCRHDVSSDICFGKAETPHESDQRIKKNTRSWGKDRVFCLTLGVITEIHIQ